MRSSKPHAGMRAVVVTSTDVYYPRIVTLVRAEGAQMTPSRVAGEHFLVALDRAEEEALMHNSQEVPRPPLARKAAEMLGLSTIHLSRLADFYLANVGWFRNQSKSEETPSRLNLYGMRDSMVTGQPNSPNEIRPYVFATRYVTESLLVRLDHRTVLGRLGLLDNPPSLTGILNGMGKLAGASDADKVASVVHSISHAIMRALAAEVGLDLTSLGEHMLPTRYAAVIYVKKPYKEPIGLLDHAVRPDVLGRVLAGAVQILARCPNDPACAKHPRSSCPACLQLPEITCGFMNRPLGRSQVKALFLGGA